MLNGLCAALMMLIWRFLVLSESFLAHVNRCEAKWIERESGKKEKDKAHLPPRPVELGYPLPQSTAEVDAFNAKMLQHWDAHSLVRCEVCERTFKCDSRNEMIAADLRLTTMCSLISFRFLLEIPDEEFSCGINWFAR